MVWADSLEQVTLCHPIMPVANGLGSGFVRIDDGQLGKRDGHLTALPTDQHEHVGGAGVFRRHTSYFDSVSLAERRDDLGSDALGMEGESDFVIEIVITAHRPLFRPVGVHDGMVVDAVFRIGSCGFLTALLPGFGAPKCARSATGGRSQPCSRRLGIASVPGWFGALRFAAGPTVDRSAEREPDRRARVPAESPFRTPRTQPVVRPWPVRRASSDRAPRSAIRNQRRDGPVPGVSRADPPPTAPNDPIATPVRHQSRGVAPRPATFPAVAAAQRRNRLPSLAWRWSSPAGRHILAGRGSARGWCVGRMWKRGRRGQRETFSDVSGAGQKPWAIVPSQRPVWRPFRSVSSAWPYTILSGHAGFIILPFASAFQCNSTASRPTGWMPAPWDASVTQRGNRTDWRSIARRCGSGS